MPSQNSHRVVYLTGLAWAAGLFVVTFAIRALIYYANQASHYQIDPVMNGFLHALLFGMPAGGAFSGYWTAKLLKRHADLPSLRVLSVALAWAVAMLLVSLSPFFLDNLILSFLDRIQPPPTAMAPAPSYIPMVLLSYGRDFLVWFISAGLSGLLLASEIRRAGLKMHAGRMARISIGWGFGFALGIIIGNSVMGLVSRVLFGLSDPGWPGTDLVVWLAFGLTGLVGGAVGSWVTLNGIRAAAQTPAAEARSLHATT